MWLVSFVVWFSGSCASGFLPCANGQCFTPRQSCDFTDDCGDGTDEKDCGTSCSFEKSRCGWKSSLSDNFDWTLGTGSARCIRPPYDHTLMDENGTWIATTHGGMDALWAGLKKLTVSKWRCFTDHSVVRERGTGLRPLVTASLPHRCSSL